MPVPGLIGRYRVQHRLGSGAFATVWLAEDEVLESLVAVKVLAENWSHHPDVRARFEQEAQMLRRVDSDRLVRVLDYGELPDGRPYQVMTYATRGTLAERLALGPVSVREALRIAAAIARAAAVLHDAGILHRDLKPSNVLFTDVRGSERVLVADLGLAKAIAFASGFTVVAGTPGYMAPEQAQLGTSGDVRADVYAIGAITYQMLTAGVPPGTAAPSRLRPEVSKDVDRIVLRAMALQPERRWPTAAALADALEAAASAPVSGRSRALRVAVRIVGVPVALTGLASLGGALPADGTPAGWTRVTDATGAVSVAVPAAWAGQLQDGGWNPAVVGLPAEPGPALAVAPDLADRNREYAGGPGVFAGTARGLERAALPGHPRCTREPDRPIPGGRITRWTGCAGTDISYSEVVTGDVYLQIKQLSADDLTNRILATVHR